MPGSLISDTPAVMKKSVAPGWKTKCLRTERRVGLYL